MHAVSRILLDNWIPNLQVSWVKEGLDVSRELLGAGVNDMGGTLINESISTSAGAPFGQLVSPRTFRSMIRDAGRIPAERTTTYAIRRRYANGEDGDDRLDAVESDSESRFGSYRQLVRLDQYRYRHPGRRGNASPESH